MTNYSFALRENIYGIILSCSIVSKHINGIIMSCSIVSKHICQSYGSTTSINRKQKRIEIFIRLDKQLFMGNTETRWEGISSSPSHCLLPIDIKQVDGSGLTVHTYLDESANSRHIIDILWQPRKNNQKG